MALAMEWFASWFDSPYYHLLYNNRDEKEAQKLLDAIIRELKPVKGEERLLDIACGKGRHSHYLQSLGFDAYGIDLSPNSIALANEGLIIPKFFVHDMRKVFEPNGFDWVLNLFTSFGYFPTEEEDKSALIYMAANLKKGGTLVMDFLNAEKVMANLVPNEEVERDGTIFRIERKISDNKVVKNITFTGGCNYYSYQEQVRLWNASTLIKAFNEIGLDLIELKGNYDWQDFDAQLSDRLILVGKKR